MISEFIDIDDTESFKSKNYDAKFKDLDNRVLSLHLIHVPEFFDVLFKFGLEYEETRSSCPGTQQHTIYDLV